MQKYHYLIRGCLFIILGFLKRFAILQKYRGWFFNPWGHKLLKNAAIVCANVSAAHALRHGGFRNLEIFKEQPIMDRDAIREQTDQWHDRIRMRNGLPKRKQISNKRSSTNNNQSAKRRKKNNSTSSSSGGTSSSGGGGTSSNTSSSTSSSTSSNDVHNNGHEFYEAKYAGEHSSSSSSSSSSSRSSSSISVSRRADTERMNSGYSVDDFEEGTLFNFNSGFFNHFLSLFNNNYRRKCLSLARRLLVRGSSLTYGSAPENLEHFL